MHNTRWQKNYTTKTYPLFPAAQSRDLRSEAETICGCMRSDQPTWPIFFWQGTGCSDSKTYASKILSLRFPSFFALSLPTAPQPFNFSAPLHSCSSGQTEPARQLLWNGTLGRMHPPALALLPFVPAGRGEFGGEAWTLALSPARCSRLRGMRAELGQLEGAALPGSDRHNRIWFWKSSLIMVGC